MKIYQALPTLASKNPYMETLIQEIDQQYEDCVWGYGINTFWSDEIFSYDIVHIHWPTLLLKGKYSSSELNHQLENIRDRNIKIVSTCHNLVAHYCHDSDINNSYNVVYSNSDMILHLGLYSLNIFKSKYPNTQNVLLPHHTYDNLYTLFPSKKDCCKKLKLSENAKYILCFGAFRDDEERSLVMNVSKHIIFHRTYIIAPAYKTITGRNRYIRAIKKYWLKYIHHIIITGTSNHPVPVDMTPYYFGISDIVFIQRKETLNSGNIPLAFHYAKTVVGPSIGNIKELLDTTKNPTFNANDLNSVYKAVKEGMTISREKHGEKNKEFAQNHLSVNQIASSLHKYYEQILTL